MNYSKNDISILISTMNRSDFSFLDAMFPHHQWRDLSLVIVNQTQKGEELKSKLENIIAINSYDVGLSKSRNLALKNCTTAIAIIADDDVVYKSDCMMIFLEAIQQRPDLALYAFKSCDFNDRDRKKYPNSIFNFSLPLNKFKPSSIEIMLNIDLVKSKNLKFNENFGLGAYYPVGEEEVFLIGLLKADLKAIFFPKTVVKHLQESSRTKVKDYDFLKTQLILYYLNNGWITNIWLYKYLFYIWRKRLQPRSEILQIYTKLKAELKRFKSSR